MQNDQSNTLLQKIESTYFEASAYPQLEAFASHLTNAFVNCVNGQIGADIEIERLRYTALSGKRSLDGKEGAYTLFAGVSGNKAGSVLVSISSKVAGAISEAMFGAEFALNDEACESTDIDVAILAMTINNVLTQLGGGKIANDGKNPQPSAMRVAPVSFASDDIARFENVTLCNIALDLTMGSAQAPDAVVFHFPMNYLDAQGLLQAGCDRDIGDAEETRWRQEMKANIDNSEIQLDIILGSFSTRLSRLADLKVDEIIAIPVTAESVSRIVLNTAEGERVIGQGRLGAYKENKAIKLLGALEPCAMPPA